MADVVARGLRFHVQRLAAAAPLDVPGVGGRAGAPLDVPGVGGRAGGGRAGAPLAVFLHGLVMDNLSSWYFSAATAAAKVADVVLHDLRGHGRSERPASGYGVDEHVADLAAILDAIGETRPAHLVGNSFGGLLALAFAAAHPDRVAGVVLVDGHVGHAGFAAQMAETLRLQGEARDQRIASSFEGWLGRHSARKRTRLADNARALVEGTTLVADLEATAPLDPARVRAPVLGVYGERSDLLDEARAFFARLPRARLVVVPGCTHSVLWEAQDRVRDEILAALAPAEAA